MKTKKTTAMRIAEEKGLAYEAHSFDVSDGALDAITAAERLGISPDAIYKTLVLEDGDASHFVAVIPGDAQLDLKKAAKVFGVKKLALMPSANLKKVTGYIHGGCSPIGMKRSFPTCLDESAKILDKIHVSAGKLGEQMVVNPVELAEKLGVKFAALTQKEE